MISYRDMTFCKHYQDCDKRSRCGRPLTPEVEAKAKAWWGGEGAPIAVFVEKPTCHSDKDKETP